MQLQVTGKILIGDLVTRYTKYFHVLGYNIKLMCGNITQYMVTMETKSNMDGENEEVEIFFPKLEEGVPNADKHFAIIGLFWFLELPLISSCHSKH